MVVIKGHSPLEIAVYQGNSTNSNAYATLTCRGVNCDTSQSAKVNGEDVDPSNDEFRVELAPGPGGP